MLSPVARTNIYSSNPKEQKRVIISGYTFLHWGVLCNSTNMHLPWFVLFFGQRGILYETVQIHSSLKNVMLHLCHFYEPWRTSEKFWELWNTDLQLYLIHHDKVNTYCDHRTNTMLHSSFPVLLLLNTYILHGSAPPEKFTVQWW